MKFTASDERASSLLNEAYKPEGARAFTEEENLAILGGLRSLLQERARALGVRSEELGELDYFGNGGELAFRGELLSWRVLEDGLLGDFSRFLAADAPEHAVILTFDFQDVVERFLECPILIVLSDEVVGGFQLCDLEDTASLLGFDTTSNRVPATD